MPANKNALIRYKTIDNCLRNPYRRWTLDDLVDPIEGTAQNKQDVGGVDLNKLLLRMLTSAVGRHVGHSAL